MSLRNRVDRFGSRLFGRAARPDAPQPPRSLDEVRAAYVERRRSRLACHVDLASTRGIEIGGFDVPTVPRGLGDCVMADSRTEHELNRLFDVPVDRILPVDYVLEPRVALSLQIEERFDYAVLCHVLEHVPNLIDFLHQVGSLLVPGGVVFIALPDKRRTDDAARASTTTARLIERHLDGVTRPSVAEVADFALAWNSELKQLYADSPQEFYRLIVEQARFAHPDVHCNVWRDEEFFLQARELILLGYLPELEIVETLPTQPPSNEFYVVVRRRAAEREAKPAAARATRRVHYRSCNFCGGGHFDVFKRIHAPFPERLYADSRPDPELGALLSLQYLTCRHCGLSAINPLPDFEVVDRHRFDAGGVLEAMGPGALDAFVRQGEEEMEILCRQYELDPHGTPGRILEIGCGPGLALRWWRDVKGWEVVGVESAKDFVDFAARRFALSLVNGRVEDLAEPDESFDVVLVNRTLQCCFDPLGVLLAAHRLLRVGGVLVVQVPNRDGLATTLADRSVQWGHWFLFSPVVLHRALEAIGFETQRVLAIQTQSDASVGALGVDLSPWQDDLVVQLPDRDAVLAQIESRHICADFFSLAARRAPDGPGAAESRARLASVSAHSHWPRRGVAIDPDSKVRWPWDGEAAVGSAPELRDAAGSDR